MSQFDVFTVDGRRFQGELISDMDLFGVSVNFSYEAAKGISKPVYLKEAREISSKSPEFTTPLLVIERAHIVAIALSEPVDRKGFFTAED